LTRCPGGEIAKRTAMDKPAVPHEIRRVFEGRVFSVVVESITTGKGSKMDVEIVRHPGSVVLIPIAADGQVILVRQYRHAIGRSAWELPAGTLKRNEEPRKGAARECHEEIGLLPAQLEELGTFFPTPGYCDEEMTFYKATGLREARPDDEQAEQDEDEDIETQAFSMKQILSMIRSGEIIDMKTVAGMLLIGRV
jgi:ADP-ribose diphosphatase